MVTESLFIKYDDADGNARSFPAASATQYSVPARITSFTYTAQRMGTAPTITATLMYPRCLDGDWTRKEYVEFRGERFYVFSIPSSSKANDDVRYKHEITFVSERIILENVFFLDVVTDDTPTNYEDRIRSNDTKLTFYGDVEEFVARLNDSMVYSGLCAVSGSGSTKAYDGYHITFDDNVLDDARGEDGELDTKELSFEESYLSEAIQEIYNTYELPYYFVGKSIHVGKAENTLANPIEYGRGKGLLTVEKTNANYKAITRITGIGSEDNIPYYYPNETASGTYELGSGTTIDPDEILSYDKQKLLSNGVSLTGGNSLVVRLPSAGFTAQQTDAQRLTFTGQRGNYVALSIPFVYILKSDDAETFTVKPNFSLCDGDGELSVSVYGCVNVDGTWQLYSDGGGKEYTVTCMVTVRVLIESASGKAYRTVCDYTAITSDGSRMGFDLTDANGVVSAYIPYDDSGVVLLHPATLKEGDVLVFSSHSWVTPIDNLMPSIFRNSDGKERFYNAVYCGDDGVRAEEEARGVDTDIYKDTGGNYIDFVNKYVLGSQHEAKQEFEDIKPTIEGIENSAGELLGELADVAYDDDDDDSVVVEDGQESGEYVHSYFYVKLHKFDGDYGFNLFDFALESESAYIEMTSGTCAGCKFEIGVVKEQSGDKYIFHNPVQADSSGNIVDGTYSDKVREKVFCDNMQDTEAYSVWIAVKKENSTYGVVIPNAEHNYKPKAGDKFVITGIRMPQQYVLAAERRLDDALIEYMKDNNEDKFTFSVDFSRTWLEDNGDTAALLNENACLTVRYNDVDYTQYITTFTYKTDENILASIEVELADTLAVQTGQLQEQLNAVQSETLAAAANIDVFSRVNRYFLRKDTPDTAQRLIRFDSGMQSGTFVSGWTQEGGSGGSVDAMGNAEFASLRIREFIEVPELRFNRVDVVSGELWNSIAFGTVESVDTDSQTVTLKLTDGETSTLAVRDLCRGMFHNLAGNDGTDEDETYDDCGFLRLAGFSTSYFTPTEILDSGKRFKYELRDGTSVHPCAGMKFAVYGNFDDDERQASAYSNRYYKRYLRGVNDWVIDPDTNISMQVGLLEGLTVSGVQMHGYGTYCDNVYMTGVTAQFTKDTQADLSAHSVVLSSYEGSAVVDSYGNVTLGTTTAEVTTSGDNVTTGGTQVVATLHALSTVVQAYSGATALELSDTAQTGTFTYSVSAVGCEAKTSGAMVVVTAVEQDASSRYVDITVNCEGRTIVRKRYTIAVVKDGEDGESVWLTAPVGSIAFDGTGRPSPSTFEVTARRRAGTKDAGGYAAYFRVFAYNGTEWVDWPFSYTTDDGDYEDVLYNEQPTANISVTVSEQTSYTSYLVRLYADVQTDGDTDASFVAEFSAGVSLRGAEGEAGYFPRDRGFFTAGEEYWYKEIGGAVYRDKVVAQVGERYYNFVVKTRSDSAVTDAPTSSAGDDNWEVMSSYSLLVADTLFASNANIGGFMASALSLRSQNTAYTVCYLGLYLPDHKTLHYAGVWSSGETYVRTIDEDGYATYPVVNYEEAYYRLKDGVSVYSGSDAPASSDAWIVYSGDDVTAGDVQLAVASTQYIYGDDNVRPMVLYSGNLYVKRSKGSITCNTGMPLDTSVWRLATSSETLAANAENAPQYETAIPILAINGADGTITMRQPDDTVWSYQPNGTQFMGVEDGQRIEISPTDKSLTVFNGSGNMVIRLTGDEHESMDSLFSGGSGEFTDVTDVNETVNSDSTLTPTIIVEDVEISDPVAISGTVYMQATYDLSATANYTERSTGMADSERSMTPYAYAELVSDDEKKVYRYKNYVRVELLVCEVSSGTHRNAYTIATVYDSQDGSSTLAAGSKKFLLSCNGSYKIVLRKTVALWANKPGVDGGTTRNTAEITATDVSVSWAEEDFFLGEVCGNGFAFGTSATNFIAALNEAGSLHVKARNGTGGFELDADGFKVYKNGTAYPVELDTNT